VFLKEEKTCYKILHFVFKLSPIVRNRDTKLEFTQTTTDFFERGSALKGLKLKSIRQNLY